MKFPALCCASLAVSLFLPACSVVDNPLDPYPTPKYNAADPNAVVPAEFLFSRYSPLNSWLDQAVRVQILDVPLVDVFRHPSLRGLQYVIVKPPPDNPLVTIDKLALTRRQLLWAISHDHQLHMTPVFGRRGEVTHIEIRSRSVDLPEAASN